MISITRQTRQGWKTYLYETMAMFQIGRPTQVRNASLAEIQEPDTPFQLDENGRRKKKAAWRAKKGKGGSKARLEKKKGERATSEFHKGAKSINQGKVVTAPAGAYGNEEEKLDGKILDGLDEVAEEYLKEAKWEGPLPKGWTPESREKFAKSLTGKTKGSPEGFVRECMKQMEGKGISDTGAFCASLKDRYVKSTEWRGEESMKYGDFFKKYEVMTEAVKKKVVDEIFDMVDQGKVNTDEEVYAMLRDHYKIKSGQEAYVKALRNQGAKITTVTEQEEEKAKETSEKEGGAKDKWTIADFKDQIEDWKKAGLDDESKLQGMIDRATEIAKKSTESAPGKATRAEVLGIMQGFMQKKG
jgi:hypothetical protein